MRRAALAAAFLGLIGSGIGCKAAFGRYDCNNDPSCAPLPAYSNPYPVVGPTQSSGVAGNPAALPEVTAPVPVKDPTP